MDVLFFNCPFCRGRVIFLSKIVEIQEISNNIIYIDNENMFDLKFWTNYKPYCIVVNYSTLFSHIVSYCISNNIAVITLEESILKQIEGQVVTLDFFSGKIKKSEPDLNSETISQNNECLDFNKIYTKDGKEVKIYATVKSIENAIQAKKMKVSNAGLVCTEFFVTEIPMLKFASSMNAICECFKSGTISIRLFDCDKDKVFFTNNFNIKERGIRAATNNSVLQIIKEQLKTIIQISKKYKVTLVIPYITNLQEIIFIDNLVRDLNNNIPIPLCAMVETPAAFFSISQMSRYVSSFSIGTNDLLSAFFCADRDSVHENYNYSSPYNWSLINFLHSYPDDFTSKTRICGQLPLYPLMLEVLISLGFTNFSIPAPLIPSTVKRICNISTIPKKELLEMTKECTNEQEMIIRFRNLFI